MIIDLCRLGIRFNHGELVKKSSLTAAVYNREFGVCLRYLSVRDDSIITPAAVASFYGLKGDAFSVLKVESNDPVVLISSLLAAAAACKLSTRLGTVAEVSAIWGQDCDALRATMTAAKKTLSSVDVCKSIFNSQSTNIETSSNPSTRPKRTSPTKSTITPRQHPLLLFSCSSIGPAFGPILMK